MMVVIYNGRQYEVTYTRYDEHKKCFAYYTGAGVFYDTDDIETRWVTKEEEQL